MGGTGGAAGANGDAGASGDGAGDARGGRPAAGAEQEAGDAEGGENSEGGEGGDTSSQPGQEQLCGGGEFSASGEPESCTAWKTCLPGEYVAEAGTASSDRECAHCADGYSNTENAPSCTEWTRCTWEMGGLVTEGTPTKDAVCGTPNEYRQIDLRSDLGAPTRLVLDGSGDVYIAGYAESASLHADDAYLVKLTSDGRIAWTRQFGSSSSNDAVTGLGVDANGKVYVTGYARDLDGPNAGGADVFLRMYDADGNLVPWAPRQFGTSVDDWVGDLALDGAGNVYISGNTEGDLGAPNLSGPDIFVRKYGSDGSIAWTGQYGTNNDFRDVGLAVDARGNTYVAGVIDFQQAFLMKFGANGQHVWTDSFGAPEGGTYAAAVSLDGSGNIYVSGTTAGSVPNASGSGRAFVRKYTSAGGHERTWQFDAYTASALAIDLEGNVLVAGSVSDGAGASDAYVRKYSPDGELIPWLPQFGTPEDDRAWSLAIDSSGALYVAGITEGSLQIPNPGGEAHIFVRRIAP